MLMKSNYLDPIVLHVVIIDVKYISWYYDNIDSGNIKWYICSEPSQNKETDSVP